MFGAIAGGIASALAGGAMSKLFGGGQKAASKQFRHGATSKSRSNRSEERFSRNAETDLVCRLLLEKKKLDRTGRTQSLRIPTCRARQSKSFRSQYLSLSF